MNRYGVPPAQAGRQARRAKSLGVSLTGVVLSSLGARRGGRAEQQLVLFRRAAEEVRAVFPCALCHLAATGGILAGREYCLDAVRPGIGLYGYLPAGSRGCSPCSPRPASMRPCRTSVRVWERAPAISGRKGEPLLYPAPRLRGRLLPRGRAGRRALHGCPGVRGRRADRGAAARPQ